MTQQFKIGDRVKLVYKISDSHDWLQTGDEGTIVELDGYYRYGVVWDVAQKSTEEFSHYLGPKGWYVNDKCLKLIHSPTKEEKVIKKISFLDTQFNSDNRYKCRTTSILKGI